jgi:hypothetical protein
LRRTADVSPVAHQHPLRIEQCAVIEAAVAPDRLARSTGKVFGLARRDHAGDGALLRSRRWRSDKVFCVDLEMIECDLP